MNTEQKQHHTKTGTVGRVACPVCHAPKCSPCRARTNGDKVVRTHAARVERDLNAAGMTR